MGRVDGATCRVAAPLVRRGGVAELLGRDLLVVRLAEVSGVVVLVAATQGQRVDMVDAGGELGAALSQAHLAQPVRPLQAALALALAGATAQAFNRHSALGQRLGPP
ncbi:hypothetical protein GGQ82_001364 [Sphingobium olei]